MKFMPTSEGWKEKRENLRIGMDMAIWLPQQKRQELSEKFKD